MKETPLGALTSLSITHQSITCGCGNLWSSPRCLRLDGSVNCRSTLHLVCLYRTPVVVALSSSRHIECCGNEADAAGICVCVCTPAVALPKATAEPMRCCVFQAICSQRASASHSLCRSWHSKGTKPARSTVAAPVNSRSQELAMPRRPRDAFPSSLIGGNSPRGVCARNPTCPLAYVPCRKVTGMASPGRRGGSPGRRGGLGSTTHTVSPSAVSTAGSGRGVTVSRQFCGEVPRCARYK